MDGYVVVIMSYNVAWRLCSMWKMKFDCYVSSNHLIDLKCDMWLYTSVDQRLSEMFVTINVHRVFALFWNAEET